MASLFGTDGVRGIPGESPLTPENVRRLGYAAAMVLLEQEGFGVRERRNGDHPVIVLGRDTRRSGPMIGRWLMQGFSLAGCLTMDLGVATTPSVAYLASSRRALCGVVISASHNPPEFNGIKFFTGRGYKASPKLEDAIERRLRTCPDPGKVARPSALKLPSSALRVYLDYLRSTVPATCDLSGLRVVLDAANGAASAVAPALLRGLGMEVFAIGCSPNGRNINTGCGALDTGAMQREVLRRHAHCGISLDGDADRAIFCDERGRLLDGDALIAMSAVHLQEQGLLRGSTVVLTVMSNFGTIRYLKSKGIETVQVPVGDRNVTDALEGGDYGLGGENSGHIVFRRFSPTGDGLLTCLQTLSVLAESTRRMSYFRSLYRGYPQLLKNLRVEQRVPLEELPELQSCIAESTRQLKGAGRIFVRYSGTEPLLRILVEGQNLIQIRKIGQRLADAFKKGTQVKS